MKIHLHNKRTKLSESGYGVKGFSFLTCNGYWAQHSLRFQNQGAWETEKINLKNDINSWIHPCLVRMLTPWNSHPSNRPVQMQRMWGRKRTSSCGIKQRAVRNRWKGRWRNTLTWPHQTFWFGRVGLGSYDIWTRLQSVSGFCHSGSSNRLFHSRKNIESWKEIVMKLSCR